MLGQSHRILIHHVHAVVESRIRRKKSRGGVGVFQYAHTVEDGAWQDEKSQKDIQVSYLSLVCYSELYAHKPRIQYLGWPKRVLQNCKPRRLFHLQSQKYPPLQYVPRETKRRGIQSFQPLRGSLQENDKRPARTPDSSCKSTCGITHPQTESIIVETPAKEHT